MTSIVKPMRPVFNYLVGNLYELQNTIDKLNCVNDEPEQPFEYMNSNFHFRKKVKYKTYIKSKVWDERTDAYLNYTGHTCQICGGKIPWGAVLHHMRYKNELGGNLVGREGINDVLVCHSGCHHNYHLSESLQKKIDSGSWARYPILPATSSSEYW